MIQSSLPWVTEVASRDGHPLIGAPTERSWEISAALAEQHIYIRELVPVQMSLEGYFLEVTGNGSPNPEEGRKS